MHLHCLFPVVWQFWLLASCNKVVTTLWELLQVPTSLISPACNNEVDNKLVAAWWNNTSSVTTCLQTCLQACCEHILLTSWEKFEKFSTHMYLYNFIHGFTSFTAHQWPHWQTCFLLWIIWSVGPSQLLQWNGWKVPPGTNSSLRKKYQTCVCTGVQWSNGRDCCCVDKLTKIDQTYSKFCRKLNTLWIFEDIPACTVHVWVK